jgi:hypothetical protein
MENICSVRQQPFEICRMRHELIEIEEYTPRGLQLFTSLFRRSVPGGASYTRTPEIATSN